MHREIAELRDLFEHYPDLPEAIEEITGISERAGFQKRLDADRYAVELARSLRGVAVNFKRLISVLLSGRDTIPVTEAAFRDRYERSFREAVRRNFFSPRTRLVAFATGRRVHSEYVRLLHLLDGRYLDFVVDSVSIALTRIWRPDLDALEMIFERLGEIDRQEVEERFTARYAGKLRVESLEQALERRLKPHDFRYINSLRRGAPIEALLARLHQELDRRRGPQLTELRSLLRERRPEELKLLRRKWRQAQGVSLPEWLDSKPWATRWPAARAAVLGLVRGRGLRADTAYLHCALKGYPKTWLGEAFVGRNLAERSEIIQHYEVRYRENFWRAFEDRVRDHTRRTLLESFILNGELTRADLLRDCLHGYGCDRTGVKEILSTATAAEIAATEEEYRKFKGPDYLEGWRFRPFRFLTRLRQAMLLAWREREPLAIFAEFHEITRVPRDLWRDLALELHGDDWFDVDQLRGGPPQSAIESFGRMVARYEHERSGRLSRFVDLFCADGRAMDRDVEAARRYFEQIQTGGEPTEAQLLRLESLVEYANHSFESFRSVKQSVSFVTANLLAGSATGATASLVFALKWPLLVVMPGCFVVSLSIRFGCRWGLAARGYGEQKFFQDLALAAVDGATLATGTVARTLLGPIGRRLLHSKLTTKILKSTSSFVLKRLVQVNSQLQSSKRSHHIRVSVLRPDSSGRELDINKILERLSLYA